MSSRAVSYILNNLNIIEKKSDRIEAAHKAARENPAILDILRLALDPKIEFLLPAIVTYNTSALGDNLDNQLHCYARKLWRVTNIGDIQDEQRRIKFYRSIIEALSIDDSALLTAIKDKKFPYKKNLSLKFIQEAFPSLIDGQVTSSS